MMSDKGLNENQSQGTGFRKVGESIVNHVAKVRNAAWKDMWVENQVESGSDHPCTTGENCAGCDRVAGVAWTECWGINPLPKGRSRGGPNESRMNCSIEVKDSDSMSESDSESESGGSSK